MHIIPFDHDQRHPIAHADDNNLEIVRMEQPTDSLPATDNQSDKLTDQDNDDIISKLATEYGCEIESPLTNSNPSSTKQYAHEQSCKTRKNDPLAWFGTLVSPSLRHSQEDFNHSLMLLIQLANLRQSILQNIDEIQSCQKHK